MTAWFNDLPLKFARSETQEATRLLLSVYNRPYKIDELAERAGVDTTVLPPHPPRYLWPEVLKTARAANRLDDLLVTVLLDDGAEAIHDGLWALAGEDYADLTMAGVARHPGSETLKKLRQVVEVHVRGEVSDDLEKINNQQARFLDVAVFREGLADAEVKIARIDYKGQAQGTGFLIGDDQLMTAFHVLRPLKENPARLDSYTARFDFKVSPSGRMGAEGTSVAFAKEWEVSSSPVRRLDYVVVRLATAVGAQSTDPKDEDSKGPQRGHFKLNPEPYAFDENEPIWIVGHPQGRPMQLSMSTPSEVKEVEASGRLLYDTNTEPGSSGSPVFNQAWQLVAIHRGAAGQNYGSPIHRVIEDMKG